MIDEATVEIEEIIDADIYSDIDFRFAIQKVTTQLTTLKRLNT